MRGRVTGVLHHPPGLSQQQALLRVDHPRFGCRNAEEGSVELRQPLANEAAPFHIGAAGLALRIAPPVAPVPALGRHLGNAIATLDEVLPERGDIRGTGKMPLMPMMATAPEAVSATAAGTCTRETAGAGVSGTAGGAACGAGAPPRTATIASG